jgi:hypothetical protein
MINKQELTTQLRESIKTITFTKVDGTERVMKCTLMDKHLPEQRDVEEYISRKKNDDVCVVWDIEKEGWRSFRIDSIKEIT